MTVSAKVRKSLPASRMGEPKSGKYPMPDKKHAGLAKAFAAMHHAPDKAEIDAKADRILAKKRGGFIDGKTKHPHAGRAGRAGGGRTPAKRDWQDSFPSEFDDKLPRETPPTKNFPTSGPMFGGEAMNAKRGGRI